MAQRYDGVDLLDRCLRRLRQPRAHDLRFPGSDRAEVVRRGFGRCVIAGRDATRVSADDGGVKRVLDVGTPRGRRPEPLGVGLVVSEQELGPLLEGKPVRTQLVMVRDQGRSPTR